MIPIIEQQRKTIAIYIASTDDKGSYPARRAVIIADQLQEEANIVFIAKDIRFFTSKGFRGIEIGGGTSLIQTIQLLEPTVLIRDSGSTTAEEITELQKIVPRLIHFDDFGEGGKGADLVFQTLYMETNESIPEQYVVGMESFIMDEALVPYAKIGLQKEKPGPIPHLVITFGDEDSGNLTYRALRHVMQLQIPLKVTILVGEQYPHDRTTLRMMALGRRNTTVVEAPFAFGEIIASADVVLCASGYMPYEVAVMGVPCVVLAQNDFELNLSFPKEHHGFIHLGLGRKVKQSHLLNALMEPLLHEPLRKKAIARQIALGLGDGKDAVCEAIRYFLEYPTRLLDGSVDTRLSDMLH